MYKVNIDDLRGAIVSLKNLLSDNSAVDAEEVLTHLQNKFAIDSAVLTPYYNALALIPLQRKREGTNHRGDNAWTSAENTLIQMYLQDASNTQTKGKSYRDLSAIIGDRTPRAVMQQAAKLSRRKTHHIPDQHSAEETKQNEENNARHIEKQLSDDSLLHSLSVIGKSVSNLEGFDIDALFSSLAQLTVLASQNTRAGEIETLEKRISELNEDNAKKDKMIERLNTELRVVRDIVRNFNELNSSQKLAQVSDYHKRLKVVVAGSGIVENVESVIEAV